MVVPQHHRLLGCGLRSGDVDVSTEHGGDGGVELVDLFLEVGDEPSLNLLLDLLQRLAARLLAIHELADPYPRQRDDLHVSGVGGDAVRAERLSDGDVGDAERGEYLERGGAVGDVRQIVVANGEERGDARCREARDAPRELALVGLRGVARLVGVAREEDEVDTAVDGVVDGVVHRGEEVEEARVNAEVLRAVDARREPVRQRVEVGLRGWASVRFDADVDVGDVQEPHGSGPHTRQVPDAAPFKKSGPFRAILSHPLGDMAWEPKGSTCRLAANGRGRGAEGTRGAWHSLSPRVVRSRVGWVVGGRLPSSGPNIALGAPAYNEWE